MSRVQVHATEPNASNWDHSARMSRKTGPPPAELGLPSGRSPPGLSQAAHRHFSWLGNGVGEGCSAWAPILTLALIPGPLSPRGTPIPQEAQRVCLASPGVFLMEGADLCSSLLPSDTHFRLPDSVVKVKVTCTARQEGSFSTRASLPAPDPAARDESKALKCVI